MQPGSALDSKDGGKDMHEPAVIPGADRTGPGLDGLRSALDDAAALAFDDEKLKST